ncbi:MAG TPA: arsenate reductase ArsC [Phototrophicaceae bacterium]|nr:arsenate reductase ArsC [Phototrophicaceae bacterium]
MKPKVLFVCTGNSARSQMGEALLRHYAGEQMEVHSAGLEPKGINPLTIQVMDEIGLDIRGQSSKSLKEYMGRTFFQYVITVCGHADANCPQPLWSQGGVKLHWPFEDPAAVVGSDEAKLAQFRLVRDQMAEKVRAWLQEREATSA